MATQTADRKRRTGSGFKTQDKPETRRRCAGQAAPAGSVQGVALALLRAEARTAEKLVRAARMDALVVDAREREAHAEHAFEVFRSLVHAEKVFRARAARASYEQAANTHRAEAAKDEAIVVGLRRQLALHFAPTLRREASPCRACAEGRRCVFHSTAARRLWRRAVVL